MDLVTMPYWYISMCSSILKLLQQGMMMRPVAGTLLDTVAGALSSGGDVQTNSRVQEWFSCNICDMDKPAFAHHAWTFVRQRLTCSCDSRSVLPRSVIATGGITQHSYFVSHA